MKILHIAPDEKFINSIYWQFNIVFKNQNKFIIYLNKEIISPKYVTLNDDIETIKEGKDSLSYCLRIVNKYDLVIFHGLDYFQSQIVLKTKNTDSFIWFFWGGELYDKPTEMKEFVLGELTKQTFIKNTIRDTVKKAIRPIYYKFVKSTNTPEKNIVDAAKKFLYFGIIHREDLEFFKSKNYLRKEAVHLIMTYYPLEFIFKGIENIQLAGDNILIGNSASHTNNHIEAFNLLKIFGTNDRKIVVPLSYGDKTYAKSICEIGEQIFDDNFEPLLNFMSLNEYNSVISKCSIVIMNHYRQQSVGNIIAMLWMGAKVYLDERNTFYHYLKRIGILVYSIDKDLTVNNHDVFTRLKEPDVIKNREILKEKLSFESIKKELFDSLTSIVNEH